MEYPELVLAPTQVAVLHQMVVGGSHRTIAETLFLSPRTVDKQVAGIKRVLGTSLRTCLGIRAVRYRLVGPHHPIDHARRARHGGMWHPPTVRQLQIIHLLAGDTPIDEACSEVGASARTIRRDLSRVAAINGARNLIHAGALFEALGWTPSAVTEDPVAQTRTIVSRLLVETPVARYSQRRQ